MADFFKALGSRRRRDILKHVLESEMHISALARELDVSVPVALRHVEILEEAGLVSRRKVGRSHIISPVLESVEKLQSVWELEESFVVQISKGSSIQDALSDVSAIKFEHSEKGSFISSVDGKEGFYLCEVNGRLIEVPVNEYKLEEECVIELKRLIPVLGKKIKITPV